jgi:cobalamin biosynthesis Mg chelatase CobN
MDLSTRYLGFDLPHPLMPGASPLVDDLDMVRRLEDAGAAAIVLHSLFEEQIEAEEHGYWSATEGTANTFAEAVTYFPQNDEYRTGPGDDLERWLVEHEYESLRQAPGSMSLERCPDPSAFERGNYMRVLQSWRP